MAYRQLNLNDAAAFLQLDPQELRAMALRGEIPCSRQGERFLFEQEDLDAWYSERILHEAVVTPLDEVRRDSHVACTSRPLILTPLCSPESIDGAMRGKTQAAVLRNLTKLATDTGLLYNPEDLYEELRKREKIGTTAIDNGVALPHPLQRDNYMFEASFVCVGRLLSPIFFGAAPDNSKTDLFFLICCREDQLHLQVLTQICMLCLNTDIIAELRNSEGPEEMYDAIRKCETELNAAKPRKGKR
ncbi:MAG: PTS transporter subunit EIIA [Lentisphaerae bacterium]|nr:PTS transporter subunit EIIA [Lentisphaerota bacterium]